MLVIARKKTQKLVIQTPEGEVWVTFIGFSLQGEARLGFEAPREIEIKRAELGDKEQDHD